MNDIPHVNVIGCMNNKLDSTFESANRVYDVSGLCPTLNTFQGGGLQPKIVQCEVIGGLSDEMKSNNGTQFYQQDRVYSQGDISPCIPANLPGGSYKFLFAMRGRDDGQNVEIRKDDLTNTITTVQKDNLLCESDLEYVFQIRRLTPRECWRLMDFTDEQYDKAAEVCSQSQLYKQAGNSIVVSCLEAIFGQLL